MASAKKLPSGRWRVQTYDHGVRRSFTADTKKEAERLAAIGLEDDRINRRRKVTLGEAIDGYIRTCRAQGYSPSTIREYEYRRRNSFSDIIDTPIDTLTVQDIQRAIDSRASVCAVKTVRNDFYFLSGVLAFYAPDLNLRKIRIAKREKPPKKVFSERWPSEILAYARERWGDGDFLLYLLFIIYTGMRPSEIYALRWDDISAEPVQIRVNGQTFEQGYIRVSKAEVRASVGYKLKPPKTESGKRTLPIDWSFFRLLYSIRERGADEDRIIEANPSTVRFRWDCVRKALDLPPTMTFYDLRHFYATSVAASGASEEELAARMGHSTSSFSHAVYVEIFAGHQDAVNAALSSATRASICEVENRLKQAKNGQISHEIAHATEDSEQ